MLRKYSNSRTLGDNIRLGSLTAFSAGMVNVASLLIFFAFTSNVTGHYAILASEIAKGNLFQIAVVLAWILIFLFGSFISNLIIIHFNNRNTYLVHATPIALEIICLLIVGFYGQYYYQETLSETEALLCLMLFAMGLQNGLTASISNSVVKTTHLTGATTDIGILLSMITKPEFRRNPEVTGKLQLLSAIAISYLIGAVACSYLYFYFGFKIFYLVSIFLVFVIVYDLYKIYLIKYMVKRKTKQVRISLDEFQTVDERLSRKEESAVY